MAVAVVVDDDKKEMQASLAILKSTGFFEKVFGFDCPEEALLFMKENESHVLFVETQVKGMNCFLFIDKLKKIHKDIFYVIMTSNENYAFEAFQKGVMNYVLKPLTPEGVERILEKLRYYNIWAKENSANKWRTFV